MKPGSAKNIENPIYDYGDGFVLIRGTEYYYPLHQEIPTGITIIAGTGKEVPSTPSCVCGWGDTTIKAETELGEFYFCHSRHGQDYEAFAKKYLEDMRIFLEHKNQLKLKL